MLSLFQTVSSWTSLIIVYISVSLIGFEECFHLSLILGTWNDWLSVSIYEWISSYYRKIRPVLRISNLKPQDMLEITLLNSQNRATHRTFKSTRNNRINVTRGRKNFLNLTFIYFRFSFSSPRGYHLLILWCHLNRTFHFGEQLIFNFPAQKSFATVSLAFNTSRSGYSNRWCSPCITAQNETQLISLCSA